MVVFSEHSSIGKSRCARALLIVLLVVLLASSIFIVTHAQHDCMGPGCHTCAKISLCGLIVDGIGLIAVFAFTPGRARVSAAVFRDANFPAGPVLIHRTPLFFDYIRLNC
jgi:hypothetical protein